MPSPPPAILWYRRDLRVHDLPALHAALAVGRVVPLFVVDPHLLNGRWASPNRSSFLHSSLLVLDHELSLRGNRLHIRIGDPSDVVPAFARECGAGSVVVSRDYAPYGRLRDARIAAALARDDVRFEEMPGQLAAEPEAIRSREGRAYTVFAPYHRAWLALPRRTVLPAPDRIEGVPGLDPGALPLPDKMGAAGAAPGLIAAGETAARSRLAAWAARGVAGYAHARDVLALGGTSRLSQDLRWGLLSPLDVLETVARLPAEPGADNAGAAPEDIDKFAAEVCWRDFYAHLLFAEPRIATSAWQPRYDAVRWRYDPASLAAWKEGRTGYPVVDAGMRQLLATGFMHNRARMVTASFLTKHLLIDWREGEAHFMRHLVDGDPASNNGGWQWAASTGADAQPYFRVFNPVLQGVRHDPGGDFVRRWVPELAAVPTKYIHAPWSMPVETQRAVGCRIGHDYPGPVVDHAFARQRALAAFEAARLS